MMKTRFTVRAVWLIDGLGGDFEGFLVLMLDSQHERRNTPSVGCEIVHREDDARPALG